MLLLLMLMLMLLLVVPAARGKVAYCTEYWVEWLVQWAKSCVRYRTTKFPELVLVSDILVDTAIAQQMAANPDCKTFDEWVPAYRAGAPMYTLVDDGDAAGTQLQGSGKQLQGAELQVAVAAVAKHIREWRPAGWWQQQWDDLAQQVEQMQQRRRGAREEQRRQQLEEELVDAITTPRWLADAAVVKYQYADIRGGEVLQSVAYTRAISRVSYNVLTNYWEQKQLPGSRDSEDTLVKYIARVQYFVKVSAPAGFECMPMRLAISDLFEVQPAAAAAGTMYYSSCYPTQPSHSSYAVSFEQSCMLDKHVMARAGAEAWFMPYKNMSGSGRAD